MNVQVDLCVCVCFNEPKHLRFQVFKDGNNVIVVNPWIIKLVVREGSIHSITNPVELWRLLVDDVIRYPPISKLPSKFSVQRSFRKPSFRLEISAELWVAFQSLSRRQSFSVDDDDGS